MATSTIDTTDLQRLRLNGNLIRALAAATPSITDRHSLARLTRKQLLRIKGIGPSRYREIAFRLYYADLKVAGERPFRDTIESLGLYGPDWTKFFLQVAATGIRTIRQLAAIDRLEAEQRFGRGSVRVLAQALDERGSRFRPPLKRTIAELGLSPACLGALTEFGLPPTTPLRRITHRQLNALKYWKSGTPAAQLYNRLGELDYDPR